MARSGAYVYCLVSSRTKPRLASGLRGVPYSGPVRVLPVTPGVWVVLSSVPLNRYGEAALGRTLRELQAISRIAVGHERIVERFLASRALLPMKILTIFSGDDRAVAHFSGQIDAIGELIERVALHNEWGIRVALLRGRARSSTSRPTSASGTARGGGSSPMSGSRYLLHKKALGDDARGRLSRARAVASELLAMVSDYASYTRETPAEELPAGRDPILLDAALLVPRAASSKLKTAVARQTRLLRADGYRIALSGPWPPDSFMQKPDRARRHRR
jgi:hypothetical protein